MHVQENHIPLNLDNSSQYGILSIGNPLKWDNSSQYGILSAWSKKAIASSLAATILLAVALQQLHSPPPNGLNWESIYISQFMRPQWKAQYCTVLHRYIKMGPIKSFYPPTLTSVSFANQEYPLELKCSIYALFKYYIPISSVIFIVPISQADCFAISRTKFFCM